MKRIIITAGGTEEYIDDVRVLTNISTGKLGYKIGQCLSALKGIKIYYIHSRNAKVPQFVESDITAIEVRTAKDTFDTIEKLMSDVKIDAIIHAMAVSDFTFKRDGAVKLKSNDPEAFIDYMRSTITKNPKIISYIKKWDPETILVGFKFEVGVSKEELIRLSKESIKNNGCDLVISNDKIEMQKANEHIAHFTFSNLYEDFSKNQILTVTGKDNIAFHIQRYLVKVLNIDF